MNIPAMALNSFVWRDVLKKDILLIYGLITQAIPFLEGYLDASMIISSKILIELMAKQRKMLSSLS